ncbi:MAG: ATP-dependent RecD-like DNA helicase [Alphaproteobacteria bacterium]|nr:ATP-dependent RecD-like DNA helicase [Alphaproteobacteria bacterium]
MDNISVSIKKITFQNKDNGFCVLKANEFGHAEEFTMLGTFANVSIGMCLNVYGEWFIDPNYGKEFKVQTYTETVPVTTKGLENYLAGGAIKGVGKKTAKKIVSAFGKEAIDVIENNPEKLAKKCEISLKKAKEIQKYWIDQTSIKNIMMFLQGFDLTPKMAAKIYAVYGPETIKIIQNNPFKIADDINGIGFKRADALAQTLGIAQDDEYRIRSGIIYALNQFNENGHTFAKKDQLINATNEMLNISSEKIEKEIDHLVENEKVILEDEAIYIPTYYYSEKNVAKILKSKAKNTNQNDLFNKNYIDSILSKSEIEYNELQKAAMKTALESNVMILTGGPGTGKTTTIKAIIDIFQKQDLKILLASPTGRAAKRMTETTGVCAKTIHRLLEYKPGEGYKKDNDDKLTGDVLIIDEISMVDILLMNALLKAVPFDMKLILIGDSDQLPSVGAGNVLHDLLDSNIIPTIKLTEIFRQAQTSKIITNAHKINVGEFPDLNNKRDSDFFYIEKETPQEIVDTIKDLVQNRLPKAYNIDPNVIQVLTPMQKGTVGTIALNQILQEAINPSAEGLKYHDYKFAINDKVMQIKNNYDKEVFNGDIGTVLGVGIKEKEVLVDFEGKSIYYDYDELSELVPAYAITIHKSQGSEYPIVVMPICNAHYVMLQRNLIYTGITRAKNLLVLIGSKKAISIAINNTKIKERNSKLKEKLLAD